MKPFILFGTWNGIRVRWDDTDLEADQSLFANQMASSLKEPALKEKAKKGDLALMYWRTENDFYGSVMGVGDKPVEELKQEFIERYNNIDNNDGRPDVGDVLTVEEVAAMSPGHEDMVTSIISMLNNDGIWPWPNAGLTFQKIEGGLKVIKKTEPLAA
jgi:hypothetical protein